MGRGASPCIGTPIGQAEDRGRLAGRKFGAFVRSEYEKWKIAVRESGASVE